MQKVYIVRDDEKFYQSYNIFENHIEAKRERVCTGVLNELSACKLKIHFSLYQIHPIKLQIDFYNTTKDTRTFISYYAHTHKHTQTFTVYIYTRSLYLSSKQTHTRIHHIELCLNRKKRD